MFHRLTRDGMPSSQFLKGPGDWDWSTSQLHLPEFFKGEIMLRNIDTLQ